MGMKRTMRWGVQDKEGVLRMLGWYESREAAMRAAAGMEGCKAVRVAHYSDGAA